VLAGVLKNCGKLLQEAEMKITPIKNSRGVAGGCIDIILSTVVCSMCGSSVPVEVANPGDQKESAWFIYHEKLGGGYCPGSEIDAIKLEKMAGLISEIKKLGFIVADIINRDPAGEAQKIIAYLLGRACYVVVDFSDGDFLEIEVTGQFLPDIISENKNDELFDNIPLMTKIPGEVNTQMDIVLICLKKDFFVRDINVKDKKYLWR
jgi:hypothetical protein